LILADLSLRRTRFIALLAVLNVLPSEPCKNDELCENDEPDAMLFTWYDPLMLDSREESEEMLDSREESEETLSEKLDACLLSL
jgi:hypothetical protein